MGACCSSASSDDEPKFTNPRDQERISGGKALEKTQMRQQAALSRFSLQETNHLALEAFRRADINDDGHMCIAELAAIFPNVCSETLDAFVSLVDKDKDGRVSANEFLATIALLTKGCDAPVQQVDACFAMFDADGDGTLSRAEFCQLIRVSVHLNLNHVLSTAEGRARLEQQLAKEYSAENIEFWKAVQAYRGLRTPEERAADAKALCDTYVREGSEHQVNLPGQVAKALLSEVDGAVPPSASAFDAAQAEIFKLMERDTFSRFKSCPEMADQLAEDFMNRVDRKGDGKVSYKDYRQWALNEPTVLVFFDGLVKASKAIVHGALQEESEREQSEQRAKRDEKV